MGFVNYDNIKRYANDSEDLTQFVDVPLFKKMTYQLSTKACSVANQEQISLFFFFGIVLTTKSIWAIKEIILTSQLCNEKRQMYNLMIRWHDETL